VNITDKWARPSSPLYFSTSIRSKRMQISTGSSDAATSTRRTAQHGHQARLRNDIRETARYFYTPKHAGCGEEFLEKQPTISTLRQSEISPRLRRRSRRTDLERSPSGSGARGDNKISVQATTTAGSTGRSANRKRWCVRQTSFFATRTSNSRQIVPSNSAVAFYTFGDKVRNARNIGPTRPFIRRGVRLVLPPSRNSKQQIIGSSLYLTGMCA